MARGLWLRSTAGSLSRIRNSLPDGIPLLRLVRAGILALAALLQWRSQPAPALVRPGARTGDGSGAGAAAVHERGGGLSRILTGSWPGPSLVGLYTLLYLARGLHAITGETQRAAACVGVVVRRGVLLAERRARCHSRRVGPARNAGSPVGRSGRRRRGRSVRTGGPHRSRARGGRPRELRRRPGRSFSVSPASATRRCSRRKSAWRRGCSASATTSAAERLSLINDQRDLERAPLATVSGLKYALRGLGSRMNLDRDVLFLSISSHGAEDPAIAVSNSQLPLQ